MPSAWIDRRGDRWIVRYRTGGRESKLFYGGSFKRKADAETRRRWVDGELAAMRVPDIHKLRDTQTARTPTVAAAADQWAHSRIDVPVQTRRMHVSALNRIWKTTPSLRSKRVDEVTFMDVTDLVARLHAAGYKRETLRKTRTVLSQVLDYAGVDPNPARDERVRLPHERQVRHPTPLADHVETVASLVAREYVLPILVIDAAGPRVSEIVLAEIRDLDEHRRAIRLREETTKEGEARYLHLPRELFSAVMATLPPREDREPNAKVFPGLTDANLRMAITRACKAGGVPHFSPHGLRRRRGSLFYKRTGSLAEVALLLGDTKRVASEHYVYALTDYREIDPQPALRRLFT
jgi:integrase